MCLLTTAEYHILLTPPPPHCCFSYFEGGVSSVYLWDLDHGFAGVILIKKAGDGSKKIKGCWDSIHVVEVQVRQLTWGCAGILLVLFGYPTETFPRCWSADSFPCRRSPVAVLLTINSPPLSCCGSRQPNLVLELWTWEAALQDRYDAQPPPSELMLCPEVTAGSNPFMFITDGEGWYSRRVLTPYCQYRPACRGQFYSNDREMQWNNISIKPIFILLSGYGEQDSLHTQWNLLWEN